MEAFLLDPTKISLAYVQGFLLAFIRIGAMFDRMPVIGGLSVPRQVRIWFAFLITVVMFPVMLNNQSIPLMPQSTGIFFTAVLLELTIGLLLGMAGSLLLTGMQLGGRFVDDTMGFSLANIIDPMTSEDVSITSQFVFLLAVIIFVVMGGLNLLIQIMAMTFDYVPLAHAPLIEHGLNANFLQYFLTTLMPQTFILAIAFAAPTKIVGLLVTTALGLVGRIVPEMNIFSFSFGVRVFIGLIMLTLSVQYLPGLMGMVFEGTEYHLKQLVHLLPAR